MTLPTVASIKASLGALWARLTADLGSLWEKDRIFLFVFGVIIVLAKGASFMVDYYANKSKKEMDAATKENAVLQAQENADDKQADSLIQQADALPGKETKVDENWDRPKGSK